MASMGCIVALPDKALFQGEITYANIPGTDGYFGVLPGHELTVSLNREGGVVTLTIGENEKREFLVMGGATSVLDDKVTVLARFGTAVEDIDAGPCAPRPPSARAPSPSWSRRTIPRIRPRL
ncbi:MAG: F0F1 ATP synthase subunit epsilon [Adlercreutzia equolifaciens]